MCRLEELFVVSDFLSLALGFGALWSVLVRFVLSIPPGMRGKKEYRGVDSNLERDWKTGRGQGCSFETCHPLRIFVCFCHTDHITS